ncbi:MULTISPECIES: VOC family protein [Yersiniaceae]|uniref:VOC family protein n=2 Tax=Yersiniaceae TaxID=1903411 RepID=A0A2N5EIW2_9GAMM|nr:MULTISPECIES: VOC family protein [Yersiniaceae]MBS0967616.1 VOC family protein [Nissabacter archeti]MDV5140921.1 VOC family protein [Chimaeribacter arupi]PLR32153.1 VOC family protein [Chimaeribacter arupi]PLR45191.1 VOC family protein [Chimaeribacter arupi]PLR47441.1 VOC family protein [Chimaeribacter arupi]
MFSHVYLGVNDFTRAFQFYSTLLPVLGLQLKFCDEQAQCAAWWQAGVARPLLVVSRPHNGEPATPGNGQMTALLARSRAQVDEAYAVALAHGAQDAGAPGLRPHYHPDYYGAYFRCPEGNKLCVCCHAPE